MELKKKIDPLLVESTDVEPRVGRANCMYYMLGPEIGAGDEPVLKDLVFLWLGQGDK